MRLGTYCGRFAPSPTGPLHAGSMVAALASWLDARAHRGRWLVRIEDVDLPRCVPGAAATILGQLAVCGLVPDEPSVYQSARSHLYQQALDRLVARGLAYGCACSRKDIADALAAQGLARERHREQVYPGTCRHGTQGRPPRAWRLRTDIHELFMPFSKEQQGDLAIEKIANQHIVRWHDRRLGAQQQAVEAEVGDFVLRRADGLWAYQLAVVVDDAAQGITDVVRGEDLADNTARQILLQRALGLPALRYLHTPLVLGRHGEKLSKQNGATPIDLFDPVQTITSALQALGLPVPSSPGDTVPALLARAVSAWQAGPAADPAPTA